jgi:outer membrane receptor protein involved in Fe transport
MSGNIFKRVRAHHLCGASLCVAVALGSSAAQAQQTETVTVTGSRLPSTFQAPTPVTVVDDTAIRLSGKVTIEDTLNETPQFRGGQGDGKYNNGQGTGGATLNLRGLGAARNLVLVNGRRFTIQDATQTTDVDTIPVALIDRTEIVTGGSSAVYGSDAITGVVNFIMKQDFEGVEAQTHVDFDRDSSTPTWSVDLTGGANFAHDKGNIAVSIGYLNRGAISRQDRGGIYIPPYGDGCVTAATASSRAIGTQITGLSGQACLNAGGKPGLVFAGSGDIPNGRYVPLSFAAIGGSNTALNTAYANAGLGGIANNNGFGFTFDNQGTTPRAAVDPDDRYNLTLPNYLQTPLERWMVNSFVHYDLFPRVTAYAEMHFSTNTVVSRLSPSNINSTMLFNTNNPYLSGSMQALLAQMDAAEPTPAGVTAVEGAKTYTTARGDGIAALTVGRRFTDVGYRISNAQRDAWRFAGGFRGTLPDVRSGFMHDLAYDIYYNYSKTVLTERENGSVSRSRLQDALLRVGTAAPVCDIFGQNITPACVTAISITSSNITSAQMAGAQASITGTLFDMPAGAAAFAVGGEWRSTSAQFTPDQFLASGDVAGFNAALPTRGSESVREFFGELGIPLVKDMPLVQSLIAKGAFRYSDYNLQGIGAVWTYSGGADWKVNDSVSFRGSYQRSIRAPNVNELFGGQTLNFTSFNDPCGNLATTAQKGSATVRAICQAQGVPATNVFTSAVQPVTLVGNVGGGNPNLAAEKSETISFGTVLTPDFVPGLALSLDWYSIGINGAIAQLGGGLVNTGNLCFNVLQDPNGIYCKAFNRDPNTGAITAPGYVQVGNANAGALKTQGIDIAGQYNFDVDWGVWADQSHISVSTSWNWMTEFTLTPVQELTSVRNECVGSFGTTCSAGNQGPLPYLKGNTRVTWTEGDLTVSLRHRYIGGTTVDTYLLPQRTVGATVPGLNTLTNPVIPAFSFFDLSMSYNVNDNIRLDGGINNLLNVGPPILGSSVSGNVTFPATYDPNGQTFFFNVTLRTD